MYHDYITIDCAFTLCVQIAVDELMKQKNKLNLCSKKEMFFTHLQ